MKILSIIIIGIVAGLLFSGRMPSLFKYEEPTVNTVALVPNPTPTPKKSEVIYEIAKAFEPKGADVMNEAINVAKNESGWRHDAQGWNCFYDGESKACKREDRGEAWSVDCGIMQINVKGKVCPVELFDIKVNIAKALAMYERRAWSPWVAARNLGYVN
jgi:hypothetical protein